MPNHSIEISRIVLQSLMTLAFLVLCALGTWVMATLRKKLHHEASYQALLNDVGKLASLAVFEIDQTLVQPMKNASDDGKLTASERSEVLNAAVARFYELLGDRKSDFWKTFDHASNAAITLIEAKVRELRLLERGK